MLYKPGMASTDNTAIADDELEGMFAPLLGHERIMVGVSGGADSMALMHLLARWFETCSRKLNDLVVVTVDHGIRPESRNEAQWVSERAHALGISHHIVEWKDETPSSALQEAAREARYKLLTEAAKDFGCTALSVAHTQDDQAETLLMRLARGSGLDGLSAMAPVSERDGVALVRPLLGLPKSRLIASLEAGGQEWIEDPSNEDLGYERVRIRKMLQSLETLGIDPTGLARSSKRLLRARLALEDMTSSVLARIVDCHGGALGQIHVPAFFDLSEEIQLRVMGQVIQAFGGRGEPPQLAKLETVTNELNLAHKRNESCSTSLGGSLIRLEVHRLQHKLHVFREPMRGDIEETEAVPGQEIVWDRRFLVTLEKDAPAGMVIAALGSDAVHELAELGLSLSSVPKEALMALPALRQGDRLIAVAHPDQVALTAEDDAASVLPDFVRFEFMSAQLFQRETME